MSHGGATSCTGEHCSSGGLREMLSRGSTACQVHHMKICKNSKDFALYLMLSSESFLHISATPAVFSTALRLPSSLAPGVTRRPTLPRASAGHLTPCLSATWTWIHQLANAPLDITPACQDSGPYLPTAHKVCRQWIFSSRLWPRPWPKGRPSRTALVTKSTWTSPSGPCTTAPRGQVAPRVRTLLL